MLTSILALAPAAPVDPAATEATADGLVGLLHRLVEAPQGLELLWFALIAVLWTGYLVLEGFDFGVGMLLPIIGKRDNERRAMLSTIGPLWDGNEVWVLTAGGATFAAFPEWYATLFSAAYLPLFLILVGLIIRAVAFEYRGKIDGVGWRKLWDWCIILGSWIPAILWGVAFANLVAGVKAGVDAAQLGPSKILYDGNFFDLVFAHNGFLLLGGLTTAALFMAHGAIFLSLKTDGEVRRRAESLAPKLSIAATVIAAVWVVWLGFKFAGGNHPTVLIWIAIAVAAVALVVVVLTTLAKKSGLAFTSMTVALLAAVVTIFAALFPNVINGSRVRITGDAVADPIVGAVVLDGVTLADVVNITFDRVAADGLPEVPAEPADNAAAITPLILENVRDQSYPALQAQGVPLPQAGVEAVVKATFDRVKDSGADLSQVGVDITEPSVLATQLTVGVLDDVANGVFPALGVISQENVVDVVTITLARLGLPTDDTTINAVVADVVAHKDALDQLKAESIEIGDLAGATIAGQPADVVAVQVAITVDALVPFIQDSVSQVVNVEVPATLQAVADNPATQKFSDGFDVTEIVTGKAWENDDGLANLNGAVDNANEALNALVVLGLLDSHTPLAQFERGDVITGQPIHAAASSEKTLKLMTIVAVCLVPIVLAYQAWSIWVFRRRISAERIPAESGLPAKA
ncbi:MAG: cytochrome d ubiquinol oxidase subunit II [Bifidobacteriaceae bacterium]|jgi:cytochrome d ubiquinol oxidase subunit II|nr:cytochrome d ubiquinol oxidase subunit II [Bifidobacteriaceae bacterium]